jgi:predicted membrane protein
METQNPYNRGPQPANPTPSNTSPKFNGRAFAGFIIVAVGSVLLARQLDVPMPRWIISWPMLLIAIGVFTGFKSSFKGIGWLILILIGSVFLFDRIIYDFDIHRYFWPILIIGFGLYMMFRSKKKGNIWGEGDNIWGSVDDSDSFFDATAIFGGVKKNIISKNFKGGDVTSIFGGSEIILSQADINGRAVLDVTAIFGGSKIIVPSNWQINTDDMTSILGGFEDKRAIIANASPDPNKVLVIKGLAMFGGIEIKSF